MLTGGGTLGPVTPLIAIRDAWLEEDPEAKFVWVGTPKGPEKDLMETLGIPFTSLSAPKLSRHAPGKWLLIPIHLIWSMRQALVILQRERPDVIVTAGGYVSVPLVWVAYLYGIPTWVHQQDIRPGIANKLMAPMAKRISVAWERTLEKYPKSKSEHIGNPVRSSVLHGSRERAGERFNLDPHRPTVVVLGGGTGSAWLNHAVAQMAPDLVNRANILHLTGKGKAVVEENEVRWYTTVEFVKDGMADVYAIADVVVCRAGMGTISELAALRKPAIIIPIPESHQEENTAILEEHKAAVILDQNRTTPQMLKQKIEDLLDSPPKRTRI